MLFYYESKERVVWCVSCVRVRGGEEEGGRGGGREGEKEGRREGESQRGHGCVREVGTLLGGKTIQRYYYTVSTYLKREIPVRLHVCVKERDQEYKFTG